MTLNTKPLEITLTLTADVLGTTNELCTAIVSPRLTFKGVTACVDLVGDVADTLEEMAKQLRASIDTPATVEVIPGTPWDVVAPLPAFAVRFPRPRPAN